ncbi:hypothetical protein HW511_02700 [Asaia siamensis]|uniref:Uncharacterized protein n=1 Tax=Asaia siamensis TaxID=110479 RepID=A0ABQ1L7P9_9PROT|nr:hypothetical protein [Asaia siamensis]GBR09162.1 hypothetical protein AA0323_2384 [Asaia siamensis NRIC 0323]GGC20704.1 hypothetical protein GCM10007207_02450 [Asaia siamensis]
MNDTPEPQLKPLTHGDDGGRHQHAHERGSMVPKLVMASAIVMACMGGAYWHSASSGSAAGLQPSRAAGPVEAAEPQIRADAIHLGAQFALIGAGQAPAALARSGFDGQQKTEILAAVKNRRMRLVRMPIAQIAGIPGQTVSITSGGITQKLMLKPELQAVVLPIYLAGEVTITPITPPPAGGLQTGILTALGPQVLPTLARLDQQIVLDVIVQ